MDALVLAGGGSRGSYQLGAYLGMKSQGFQPNLVVGTSVGAINGAHIASGLSTNAMRDIWLHLRKRDVGRIRTDIWRFWTWQGLLDPAPLRRLLERLDYRAIHRAPFEFLVTATDMGSGQVRVWHKDELTPDHLLASAAIPGLFPPVEIDGRVYMDGAISNNAPIRPAVREGADRVFLILTDDINPHPEPPPRNVPQILGRVADIHMHQALLREYIKGKEINALLAAGRTWADWRPIDFHILTPSRDLHGTNDYHPQRNAVRLAAGEADGVAFMQRVRRDE